MESSALAKLYLNERGSAWVRALLTTRRDELFIAQAALVEVTATLFRAVRGGMLGQSQAQQGAADLVRRAGAELRVVDVDDSILARALEVAERHALRGYDCVQLATAMVTHEDRLAAGLDAIVLVSSDGELNAAAEEEGLAVEDPNAH